MVTRRDQSVLPAEADQRDINLYLLSAAQTSTFSIWRFDCFDTISIARLEQRSHVFRTHNTDLVRPIPLFAPNQDAIYTMATHIIRPPPSFCHPVLSMFCKRPFLS